jgi:hypothetical protein
VTAITDEYPNWPEVHIMKKQQQEWNPKGFDV